MRSEVQADLAAVEVLLPLRLEALLAAESQVDVFLDQLGTGHNETLSYALKLIVNEGFRNALELEPVEGRLRLVRLLMQAGPGGIRVDLRDPGPGFHLQGHLPPYPDSWIGHEFPFSSVLGQQLFARVESPYRLSFRVERTAMDAANGRESLVEQTKPSGMGILSLCYVCEDVAMEYHPEHGNGLHATYRIELDELRFTRPLAIE